MRAAGFGKRCVKAFFFHQSEKFAVIRKAEIVLAADKFEFGIIGGIFRFRNKAENIVFPFRFIAENRASFGFIRNIFFRMKV